MAEILNIGHCYNQMGHCACALRNRSIEKQPPPFFEMVFKNFGLRLRFLFSFVNHLVYNQEKRIMNNGK